MIASDEALRRREEHQIDVIIGANQRSIKAEDRALRLHLDCGALRRGQGHDIMATCDNPKCRHDNNITKNRSIYCGQCGSLLTDRHY